ncbi:GlcG/HbpS family heme-binding protein [Marinoscillum furvescens]|uniref:Uncharacterized protein GlcG (DUF336 family) n=1 Tax=Marinoscillum furvescens DSM 4134 TaxID=1122208 RepID=A0A3D9L4I3_MARFU|nr:heme-binding protein [Marinoscillum furvescens]RED98916.1 uncharacterized protein GlcG (DUF336 family) [Marinoscillum furvescens DSM 4134]
MLKLKEAQQLCEAVLQYGQDRQLHPLTVSVLDTGGHPLCILRHERSGILRYEIAFGKAWGALGLGMGTRVYSELTAAEGTSQSFVHALMNASAGRVVPTRGGVLIRNVSGDLLGAIGVSGDTPQNDESAALYALNHFNFIAQP